MIVDLHCHSHFSDGALSPEALHVKAVCEGVQVLALTDHDTTAGLASLHAAAYNSSVKIINGIELSTRWGKYDVHILGLAIDPDEQALRDLIEQQNSHRIVRAIEMSNRLAECGLHNAYQKACHIAGHERVGRPHLAQALVKEGIVSDMKTAFKRFLVRGRAAYVPTDWPSVDQVVQAIVNAGGQAVIAHPLKYDLTRSKLREFITTFKTAGGVGMEIVSGNTTTNDVNELALLCQRFDLLASTGSDYHGGDTVPVSLGRQRPLPDNCKPIWHTWTFI